jgi:hypothetical protein
VHEEKINQNATLLSEARFSERQLLAAKWMMFESMGKAESRHAAR